MKHHIHWGVHPRPRNPYGFPHAALEAVAFHRPTQGLTDREPYTHQVARSGSCTRFRPPQEKHGHVTGELAAARLVNALKVRVSQKPFRLRKRTGGGHKLLPRPVPELSKTGSGGGSSHSILPCVELIAVPADTDRCGYSRKPGFTATRLRPLARRREITARPLLVFIRVRNPCVFERRRRLGWNVRFGIRKLRSSLRQNGIGQTQSISVSVPRWQPAGRCRPSKLVLRWATRKQCSACVRGSPVRPWWAANWRFLWFVRRVLGCFWS